MHDSSVFVTLTYNNDNCPTSLQYRDFQLFMKRLRRKMGPVRFYMCGEYGDQFSRPHFHACLFGCFFSDRVLHSHGPSGSSLFRSKVLESLWPYGFASIGDVTFESAAYVARYVMKKVTGPAAESHYERVCLSTGELVRVTPEFCQMSRNPGIGATWFAKYKSDVFGYERDGVYIKDMKSKPPRAYMKYLEKADPDVFESVEFSRYKGITPAVVSDATPERLKVREQVTAARLSFKSRSLV
jgi:hypothetical protein